MPSNSTKVIRCAIYTRKSTEHGLDQEFNSLDAQREACEAYIKSQASQGWKALSQEYDDPAYSGGNLERPALKRLLRDIESGRIDVIVVYKIDRLTRSLADFAKLVEAFDAKSISFVAVTQQFNTTTSMGRLTLNVLLSFAQFERELASERVRDKVAASRKKGKWTGGTVPLGYDAQDKKLVINKTEAETVRTIFGLYLERKSFGKVVAELDRRKIVTKRRDTKVAKYNGGIPFTYGPLAYFLKNRIYVGEMHHGGKWFKGEHQAILDRPTFERAQNLLKSNRVTRRIKHSESGTLLRGKLFDDKGNAMSPSFTSKNGVRYRSYVSTALNGRKHKAGSVTRIPAPEIEAIIEHAVRCKLDEQGDSREAVWDRIERAVVGAKSVRVTLTSMNADMTPAETIDIAWTAKNPSLPNASTVTPGPEPDRKLLLALVRAQIWLSDLANNRSPSVEELAIKVDIHPKVMREALKLAFLAPDIMTSIFAGEAMVELADLRNVSALSWRSQREELHHRRTQHSN
ncbi:recombinase family protein [Bradyrhizobium erythrophlei]|uniref:Site-specific DNA recombinase n=1 Tax=Bradyrhizobium erythrophlei TaxID=1437360 RepID=A0A1M7T5Z8_9BRAD|nr:recombinase family protein [Bradyrhizobium erythrophlei]SHN66164.1 Site-specific DNA recombinase [Bradyrhizobium erythrophlei]